MTYWPMSTGSLADIPRPAGYVRFAPDNGHESGHHFCPLSAKSDLNSR
jgi:hypothetical protein